MHFTEMIPDYKIDLDDVGKCHVLVKKAFPEDVRYLFSRHGNKIWITSPNPPSAIPDQVTIRTKPFNPKLDKGMKIPFRIKANPTRPCFEDGKRKKKPILGEERLPWLVNIMGQFCGCKIIEARIETGKVEKGTHRPGMPPLVFNSVTYDGLLQVEDKDRLLKALQDGIGSGKAYGFGMLMLMMNHAQRG